MMTWVDHKEVARGEIWGDWKRFKYYCNGHLVYIYCHSKKVFLELFAGWVAWASQKWYKGMYSYTLESLDGEDIATEDIIFDRPEGTAFRVKCLIWATAGEYIQ